MDRPGSMRAAVPLTTIDTCGVQPAPVVGGLPLPAAGETGADGAAAEAAGNTVSCALRFMREAPMGGCHRNRSRPCLRTMRRLRPFPNPTRTARRPTAGRDAVTPRADTRRAWREPPFRLLAGSRHRGRRLRQHAPCGLSAGVTNGGPPDRTGVRRTGMLRRGRRSRRLVYDRVPPARDERTGSEDRSGLEQRAAGENASHRRHT